MKYLKTYQGICEELSNDTYTNTFMGLKDKGYDDRAVNIASHVASNILKKNPFLEKYILEFEYINDNGDVDIFKAVPFIHISEIDDDNDQHYIEWDDEDGQEGLIVLNIDIYILDENIMKKFITDTKNSIIKIKPKFDLYSIYINWYDEMEGDGVQFVLNNDPFYSFDKNQAIFNNHAERIKLHLDENDNNIDIFMTLLYDIYSREFNLKRLDSNIMEYDWIENEFMNQFNINFNSLDFAKFILEKKFRIKSFIRSD